MAGVDTEYVNFDARTTVIAARRRHRNQQRIGAHARRQIRRSQIDLYRRIGLRFVGPVVVLGVVLGVLHWLLPDLLAPYIVGGLIVAVLSQFHQLGLDASGMATQRIGLMAEQWSAAELDHLPNRSWTITHHVMLERRDIDHVAIGPAGVIAVETKFRSDWTHVDLERLANNSAFDTRQLASRIGQPHTNLRAVVAMWGPDTPDTVEHHGVLLCPGDELAEHLAYLPARLDTHDQTRARVGLDDYLDKRDTGELTAHGPVPTTLSAMINQLVAIVVVVIAAAYLVALSAHPSLPHPAIPFVAGTITVIAWTIRRRFPIAFVQRTTAAAMTSAAGAGSLLTIAWLISR